MTKQIRPRIAKLSEPQPRLCVVCWNVLQFVPGRPGAPNKEWVCPKGHQQPEKAA